MTRRLEIFVEWELQASRRFLREAIHHFDTRLSEVQNDSSASEGLLTEREELQGARRLVLESVVYQLNAIIDFFLLACAPGSPFVGEVPTAAELTKRLTRSRTDLIKEVERRHSLKVSDLAGWHEIEWLRESANALKHRGGSLGFVETPIGIPMNSGVQLDVERLASCIDGVRSWTSLLTRSVHENSP